MIKIFLLLATLAFSSLPAKLPLEIQPYLLPKNHPMKRELDAFFGKKRWIFHEKAMKEAGFTSSTPRAFTHLIVAKHPKFPGLVFKIYLDVQRYYRSKPEWAHWIRRIQGAQLIREEVIDRGWEDHFKIPRKWIYALPESPSPDKDYLPKSTILVEEDMQILGEEKNKAAWKSDQITPELLTKIHHIIKKLGLLDCAKIDNIPLCKDGRIAFIDTQTFNASEIIWESLDHSLNAENRAFWRSLVNQD